jgi:hypothetical protein
MLRISRRPIPHGMTDRLLILSWIDASHESSTHMVSIRFVLL